MVYCSENGAKSWLWNWGFHRTTWDLTRLRVTTSGAATDCRLSTAKAIGGPGTRTFDLFGDRRLAHLTPASEGGKAVFVFKCRPPVWHIQWNAQIIDTLSDRKAWKLPRAAVGKKCREMGKCCCQQYPREPKKTGYNLTKIGIWSVNGSFPGVLSGALGRRL